MVHSLGWIPLRPDDPGVAQVLYREPLEAWRQHARLGMSIAVESRQGVVR
jgi:hypothetical protein